MEIDATTGRAPCSQLVEVMVEDSESQVQVPAANGSKKREMEEMLQQQQEQQQSQQDEHKHQEQTEDQESKTVTTSTTPTSMAHSEVISEANKRPKVEAKKNWLAYSGVRKSRVGVEYQVASLPSPGDWSQSAAKAPTMASANGQEKA